MAEFASISSLLREKCEENSELHKYCQTIAAKYLDFAKKELHAQNAREENIMLKLDIGNLQSIYRTVNENNEAQAELDSLLMEYYDEHLKSAFDIDECELEKLASYDEIKLELETRESINLYQRLYECKVKMAKKMEQRNIVQKYRQAEQEYLKTKTERLHLEELVNKLKDKDEEFKARRLEESKLILQMVQGSAELKVIYAALYPQNSQSQVKMSGSKRLSGITLSDIDIQKVGLSSRLLVDFKQFKIPSIPALPKIRQLNQRNGLNRLLQQSEVIRKSMQTSPIVLSGEFTTTKIPGILKIPNEYPKQTEFSQKTVSFDVNLHRDVTRSIETQDIAPKTPCDTLDPSYSEYVEESEMEGSLIEKESKTEKIVIIEDVLIKTGDQAGAQPRVNIKRKTDNEDSEYQESPPKLKKGSPSQTPIINIGSKSFMDMFLDFSKDTPETSSINDLNQASKQSSEIKKPMEEKCKEMMQKKDKKPKTKALNKQFDGFENFLSQFAGDTSETKEKAEPVADDVSFDFLEGNDDDNFSFEF